MFALLKVRASSYLDLQWELYTIIPDRGENLSNEVRHFSVIFHSNDVKIISLAA